MHRHGLTDDQWRELQRGPTATEARGRPATRGDRLFIEAVLYRAKTGMPWRDLPERFGPWKSVYNRFANWARTGHWATIFKELQVEVDDTGFHRRWFHYPRSSIVGRKGESTMLWATLEELFRPSSTRSSTSRPAATHHTHAGAPARDDRRDELLAHARGKALIGDTVTTRIVFRQPSRPRDRGLSSARSLSVHASFRRSGSCTESAISSKSSSTASSASAPLRPVSRRPRVTTSPSST